METRIYRVVRQGETFSVQSSKQESGELKKCNIVLREMGGSKYENEYACTMLGNMAETRFQVGEVIAATLRFTVKEYNGQSYQDIMVTDLYKISPSAF